MKNFICKTHGVMYSNKDNTTRIISKGFKQCYLLTSHKNKIEEGKHNTCIVEKVGEK